MATGDETIVLTSSFDRRNQEPVLQPIWEYVATATYDADDTGDVTLAIPINGVLTQVVLEMPDFTNGITGQVQIQDNRDNVVFDSGEKAENATHVMNTQTALRGTIDVVVGVSGAAGGTGADIVVVLRGI